jgi:hypothetical protein
MKNALTIMAMFLLPPAIVLLPLVTVCFYFFFNACLTETRETITDLSGLDFLVSETNCDVIAKTDQISIYISKTGEKKWDLILKYDPATDRGAPDFDVDQKGAILVSIPCAT